MQKQIKTNLQLKMKLASYNFAFDQKDFDLLLKRGYYHIINSYSSQEIRNDGKEKFLSDYLLIDDLNISLSAILFPMLINIEGFLKQRIIDVITTEILSNSEFGSTHEYVVKHCADKNKIFEIKKEMLSTNFKGIDAKNNRILRHFFDENNELPIWALLEIATLGTTADLISKFDKKIWKKIDQSTYLDYPFLILEKKQFTTYRIMLELKKIRNNIAHNQPIIDCRFGKTDKPEKEKMNDLLKFIYKKYIVLEEREQKNFDLINFGFTRILDYLFLIALLSKIMELNIFFLNNLVNFLKEEIINNPKFIDENMIKKYFGKNYVKKIEFLSKLL